MFLALCAKAKSCAENKFQKMRRRTHKFLDLQTKIDKYLSWFGSISVVNVINKQLILEIQIFKLYNTSNKYGIEWKQLIGKILRYNEVVKGFINQ